MHRNERRIEKRWPQHLRVRLVMWDIWGEAFSEDTVTENVSRCGAAVQSDLPLREGRFLQVIRPYYTKSFIARVRAKSDGTGKQVLLHLQFVNQEWPLEVPH